MKMAGIHFRRRSIVQKIKYKKEKKKSKKNNQTKRKSIR